MARRRARSRPRGGRVARGRRVVAERGRFAAQAARRATARRVARWLRSQDPNVLDDLAEVGLLSRDWLEGAGTPFGDAAPLTVVTRTLEALVERRPSTLSTLGLSTIQVLAAASGDHTAGTGRRMSVAFADLRGFTAFTAEHGDEAARNVLHDYYLTAGRIVRSRGGRIVKRLGDGLLVTFHDATSAMLAAVELAGYSAAAEQPEAGALQNALAVRAGIDTGDVLVELDDIAGHTVNVASRVTDVAAAGEVLVTGETAAAAADDARLTIEPAQPVQLRGLRDPVPVHRVTLSLGRAGA